MSPEYLTSASKIDFIERSMVVTHLGPSRDWGVEAQRHAVQALRIHDRPLRGRRQHAARAGGPHPGRAAGVRRAQDPRPRRLVLPGRRHGGRGGGGRGARPARAARRGGVAVPLLRSPFRRRPPPAAGRGRPLEPGAGGPARGMAAGDRGAPGTGAGVRGPAGGDRPGLGRLRHLARHRGQEGADDQARAPALEGRHRGRSSSAPATRHSGSTTRTAMSASRGRAIARATSGPPRPAPLPAGCRGGRSRGSA